MHSVALQFRLAIATVYARMTAGEGMSSSGVVGRHNPQLFTIRNLTYDGAFDLGRTRQIGVRRLRHRDRACGQARGVVISDLAINPAVDACAPRRLFPLQRA